MDRCLCKPLLLGKTLVAIKDKDTLGGLTGLEMGIRLADYNESTQSMLKTLAEGVDLHLGIEDYKNDGHSISWKFKGVPINIKIIHNKYEFFENPSLLFYMGEDHKVPNPFESYWEQREEIE